MCGSRAVCTLSSFRQKQCGPMQRATAGGMRGPRPCATWRADGARAGACCGLVPLSSTSC
eukprot:5119217-Prymnesium_polylepis.1